MPTMTSARSKAKDEKLQAHKLSDTEYRVYNPTSKSSYSVIQSINGTWYCTCPFATKSSDGSTKTNPCKHLARVLDKETGCIKCGAKDKRLENQECVHCRQLDKMGFS